MKTNRALAICLLVVVMIIWGSTFVVTKSALAELPPLLFALLRFLVASAVLLPIALSRGGLARLPRPVPWGLLLAMAFAGVLLYYMAFNASMVYTSASQGALVQSSIPIVTALLAALWLREHLSLQRAAGIALAVIGVVLIFARTTGGATAPAPLLGNLLMFGAVLTWAVYTILAKRVAHADPLIVITCVTVLGTAMLAAPAMVEGWNHPLPKVSVAAWAGVIYLGVFASAVCFLLYSNALRVLDASQVATFVNLVPLVGIATGMIFLDETLSPTAFAGGALVLAGVWQSSRAR